MLVQETKARGIPQNSLQAAGSCTLPRCWQTLPVSDTERSPGHVASCQKFPSPQARSLLPCLASLGPSTGASLTNTPPGRVRRGGGTAHTGEKPCVMPPLPAVGKWPLRGGRALRSASTGQDPRRLLTTSCLTCGRSAQGAAPGVSQRFGQCQTEVPQRTRKHR